MKRRSLLAGTGVALATATSGCVSRFRGVGITTETEWDIGQVERPTRADAENPPRVVVDGGTIVIEGILERGSGSCGTIEVAHVEYVPSQQRLDVLVVAGEDTGLLNDGCTLSRAIDDYRTEITLRDIEDIRLRSVVVTEHDARGRAFSTAVGVTPDTGLGSGGPKLNASSVES